MIDIKEKVYDISLVVQDIKEFPQTYKSILKEYQSNGTLQTILRRKLSKLCKNGIVCKTNIPGTRFGKTIFYHFPKNYHILIEAGRTGSNVFCFFKYEKLNRFYIEIKPYWELKSGVWEKKKSKVIFEGSVLKWV